MTNEEKTIAGFRDAYIYEYRAEQGWDGTRKRGNDYLTRHRMKIKELINDVGSKEKLQRLLLCMQLDRDTPIVINYLPEDEREYEFIYFQLATRGFKEIYFVNDYVVSDLTKYLSTEVRRTQGEKINLARIEKVSKGKTVWTRMPYGYKKKQDRVLLNEYEAFVVRFIYFRRKEGAKIGLIAKELNARSFHNRNGHDFNYDNIRDILDNERTYQGYVVFKGVEYKGSHQPLIDEEGYPLLDVGKRLAKADLMISRATRQKLDELLGRRYDDK